MLFALYFNILIVIKLLFWSLMHLRFQMIWLLTISLRLIWAKRRIGTIEQSTSRIRHRKLTLTPSSPSRAPCLPRWMWPSRKLIVKKSHCCSAQIVQRPCTSTVSAKRTTTSAAKITILSLHSTCTSMTFNRHCGSRSRFPSTPNWIYNSFSLHSAREYHNLDFGLIYNLK